MLTRLSAYRYRIPWVPAMRRAGEDPLRRGLLLHAVFSNGSEGWGEAAPLPRFSRETYDAVEQTAIEAGLDRLRAALTGAPFTELPSLQCALECAALTESGFVPSHDAVPVNALLPFDKPVEAALRRKEQGFATFKLKIGGRPLYADVSLVRELRQALGESAILRLDANRSFDIPEAVEFCDAVAPFGIEYIEEPVRNLRQLKYFLEQYRPAVTIALDESLRETDPRSIPGSLANLVGIIKPSLSGWYASQAIASELARRQWETVVTGSFETSLGLFHCARLAATVSPHTAAGLDTLAALESDVVEPPLRLKKGRIHGLSSPQLPFRVCTEKLERIRG